MRYIEQIPRTENSPFWTTELMDIEAIREWILANCDITKRHVISSSRGGPVIAEGIKLVRYFGWTYDYRPSPRIKTCDHEMATYKGYKVFKTSEEATNYYKGAKVVADAKLGSDEAEVNLLLQQLKEKGIELDAVGYADDDSGLGAHLCVSCTVNGFHFERKINK